MVATTTIWADVVRNVACDGLADVQTIVPAGGDPHSFEPSLRDRETMSNAALIVANGLGLEESMADIVGAVESEGVPVVRVGESVDTIPAGAGEHTDESGDDGHGADDPHIWFDPTRVGGDASGHRRRARRSGTRPAPRLDACVSAYHRALANSGIDRTALDACVDAYSDSLATLDTDIAAAVARSRSSSDCSSPTTTH